MPLLTVIPLASLPAPGLPPSAIDALGTPSAPARLSKRSGYNCVEFGFKSTDMGSGSYALYKYWPGSAGQPGSASWKPEGPRGATPTTIDMGTVAGSVPVRVSTEIAECEFCVVLCAGAGVVGPDSGTVSAELREQNR